ncbi:hypothetical protein ACFV98_26850 [Streptomyces violascens]|uniref:hypothetical protein n=1 Tax=Streptomyces violascens TaxID=67381 RepID=UPI003668207C
MCHSHFAVPPELRRMPQERPALEAAAVQGGQVGELTADVIDDGVGGPGAPGELCRVVDAGEMVGDDGAD